MSGHSHWHGIRHKKALTDAKKSNIFTKIGKLIAIAAREGGGNPDANFKLKLFVAKARSANMPKESIEKAIKRGTGELKDGAEIQEVTYEAYGPGQVAIMIKTATDNKNRTVGELKNILNKAGGQMVPSGSVGFLFSSRGIIILEKPNTLISGEDVALLAIDSGADDFIEEEDRYIILSEPKNLKGVEDALAKKNISIESSALGYWPLQKITLDEQSLQTYETLLEQLDDNEDVQDIYDNI